MLWLTPEAVGNWAQADTVAGNEALVDATAAARRFVERKRADLFVVTDPDADPPVSVYAPGDDVILGAKMLAARLYERRAALLGVAGFQGYEVETAQILRYDPDIEALLQIGRAAPFGFGAGPVDEAAS